MGYTHYWRHDQAKGAIAPEAWSKITDAARLIIAAASQKQIHLWHEYDKPGTEPEISDERIFFNGAGDNGHETFVLERLGDDFQFCKTARKPYDEVVTAILGVAGHFAPDYLAISSDGDELEWNDGLLLAGEATGLELLWPVKEDEAA